MVKPILNYRSEFFFGFFFGGGRGVGGGGVHSAPDIERVHTKFLKTGFGYEITNL